MFSFTHKKQGGTKPLAAGSGSVDDDTHHHHPHQGSANEYSHNAGHSAIDDMDPHDSSKKMGSPSSPLSLTDENLQNLNNISSLPPPSLTSSSHSQHIPTARTSISSRLPSETMSESSLIFERYVQDPFPAVQQPQFPSSAQSPPQPPSLQRQGSIFLTPTHLANENFIPLAIDSTTALLQSNTDLDEVDMIYSPRRSSVLNLSSAFNSPQQPPSRRGSIATNMTGMKSPTLMRSNSLFNSTNPGQQQQQLTNNKPPPLKERKSMISFLSYADMIQNEDQDQSIPRRPSVSQTLSASFVPSPALQHRSRHGSLSSSRTPNRQPSFFNNSPTISRQTSARNSMLNKLNTKQQKFHLAPDSPTSESSDNEDLVLVKSNSRNHSMTANQLSHVNSLISSQKIDDVLESPDQYSEPEIVVSSVGDAIRQHSQDIRSS